MLSILLFLTATPAIAAPSEKPPIILVIWDAARPANMSPYGYTRDTTPNIDAWAKQSTVFDNAQTTSTWSVPAVAGIFTGLFSHNHRVNYDTRPSDNALTASTHTLAELLKDQGYRTGLFTAQGSYLKQTGFKQGFDSTAHVSQQALLQRGLAFLDAGSEPAFLVLHSLNPHAPYTPDPTWDLWSNPTTPIVYLGNRKEPGWHRPSAINTGADTLSQPDMQRLLDQYDGELLANDAIFGQLLDGLSDRSMKDNAIVILTGTHGEAFGEHPRQMVWHDLPYNSILNVPLIISGPGFEAKHVTTRVRNIDIYPTVAQAIGATPPHALNGEPLQSLLQAETTDRPNIGTSHFSGAPSFYVTESQKLFYLRRHEGDEEVYDMAADPDEQQNIANTKNVIQLKQAQQAFIKSTTIPLAQ